MGRPAEGRVSPAAAAGALSEMLVQQLGCSLQEAEFALAAASGNAELAARLIIDDLPAAPSAVATNGACSNALGASSPAVGRRSFDAVTDNEERANQARDDRPADPTDPRATAEFWRSRHSEVPLRTACEQEMTVRFLVPLPLKERVVLAGGRIVHASMRKLLGPENADATGFTIDMAVAEGRICGGRFGSSMQVVAASYRWDGVAQRELPSGRTVTMPSNNNWFVRYLDNHQVLGWLDYLAHDFGDPALQNGVLRHMGRIYSALTVVPDYLLDPTKTKVAMTRGWIYQESAFTKLGGNELASYAEKMREVLRWFELADHVPDQLPSWARGRDDIATAVEGLGALYERRCGPLFPPNRAGFADTAEKIRSSTPPCRCSADRILFQLENYLREIAQARSPRPFAVALHTYGPYSARPTEILMRCVPSSILDAFATLDFTQESDFVVGALSQIAQQYFGEVLGDQDVLAAAGLLDFMLEQHRALGAAGGLDERRFEQVLARLQQLWDKQKIGGERKESAMLLAMLPRTENGLLPFLADHWGSFALRLARQEWNARQRAQQELAKRERAEQERVAEQERLARLKRNLQSGTLCGSQNWRGILALKKSKCAPVPSAIGTAPDTTPYRALPQSTAAPSDAKLGQSASSFYGTTPTDKGKEKQRVPKAPSVLETRKRRHYKTQGLLKDYLDGKPVPAVPGSVMRG